MACIKPPAAVTMAIQPQGPTRASKNLSASDLGHTFNAEPGNWGQFKGGHHDSTGPTLYLRERGPGISANEVTVDLQSGSSSMRDATTQLSGQEYSKTNHSMYNPALSESDVAAEVESALADENATMEVQNNGNIKIIGVSKSGTKIEVIKNGSGEIITTYPKS